MRLYSCDDTAGQLALQATLILQVRKGYLIADLLFGNGMDRYVGAMQRPDSSLEVNVRSFSAGSFSGLAFLHILWSIPKVTTKGCLGAIACPPSLLNTEA